MGQHAVRSAWIRGGRTHGAAWRRPVSTWQNATAPSGRAFQHNTAGVKRDFQQHAMQHTQEVVNGMAGMTFVKLEACFEPSIA